MGLLLAVGVWAYDDAQKDQIAPGIKVGGVDVGGRDADSARKIIKREVVEPLEQPVVVTYAGKDYTLSPKRLHATADVDGMVQEAIDRSREGTIFDRVTRYASGVRLVTTSSLVSPTTSRRSRTSSTRLRRRSIRTRSTRRWCRAAPGSRSRLVRLAVRLRSGR